MDDLFSRRLNRATGEDQSPSPPSGRQDSERRSNRLQPFGRPSGAPPSPSASSRQRSLFATPNTTQTRINHMVSILSLTPENEALLTQILQTARPEDDLLVILAFQARMTQDITSAFAVHKAVTTDNWTASTALKKYLRPHFAILILGEDLQTYSEVENDVNLVYERSFERVAMLFVRDEDEDFKADNLPEGFGLEDGGAADRKVLAFVRTLTKHSRGNFRGALLLYIQPTAGLPSKKCVQNAEQLVGHVSRKWLHDKKDGVKKDSQIWKDADPNFKLRLIFLRYIAAHFYKNPAENRKECQWDLADRILIELATKSHEYQKAYYGLILERDAQIFTGKLLWAAIAANNTFPLPTEAEVEEQMALDASEAASEALALGGSGEA